jgi:glycerol uptake facilitator protein
VVRGGGHTSLSVEVTAPRREESKDVSVIEHSLPQRLASEMIGTGVLVLVGVGSVPAVLLAGAKSGAPFSGAEVGMIALVFGFVVAALVYTLGKVSGCHINPAVTFALALTRRFPWIEVPLYVLSQAVGAVLGALGVWAAFGERAIDLGYGFGLTHFDESVTSWGSAVFVEGAATAVLVFTIFGVVDRRTPEGWAGFVVGLVLVAIEITFIPITGASVNPARSFGPLAISTVNSSAHNWLQYLAYVGAQLTGAAVAAITYLVVAGPPRQFRPIRAATSHDETSP